MSVNDTAIDGQTEGTCEAYCGATAGCVAVTRDHQLSGNCWLHSVVELDMCNRSASFDTYMAGKNQSFETPLQEQLERVVAHYRQTFPDLTISVAWRDASREVTAVAGEVFGRNATASDTFLYGSGTKPLTAVGVLRLIDSGKVEATDKASAHIDPYLRAHNRSSLAEFFTEAIDNATVLDLVEMTSGIRDFEDSYDFDTWVLGNDSSKFWDYPYDAMRFAVSDDNTKGGEPLYFAPGAGSAYSSKHGL